VLPQADNFDRWRSKLDSLAQDGEWRTKSDGMEIRESVGHDTSGFVSFPMPHEDIGEQAEQRVFGWGNKYGI